MKHTLFTLIMLAIFSSLAYAQSIQLVKSFENNDTLPKYYCQYVEFNNKLYFTSGNYLWVSDGTATGTIAVYGFRKAGYNTVNGLTVLNNKLVFMADDSVHGWELWVSDGTTSGTSILTDINPGPAWGAFGSFSNNLNQNIENRLAITNGAIYFHGNDGQNGIELWRSDGTALGTQMVKDINTTPMMGFTDTPGLWEITPINNNLFFYANDSIHGFELWISDGTTRGTRIVKDIIPGKIGTRSIILPFNGKAIISGYITDGIDTNTLFIGNGGIAAVDYAELNGKFFYYGSSYKLIVTDGTTFGTSELMRVSISQNFQNGKAINLTQYKNHVYFTARNTDSITQVGLWKTDGTVAGTKLVYQTLNYPHGLAIINDKLYFKVEDPNTHIVDIWESDGTTSGTMQTPNSFSKPSGSVLTAYNLVTGNFTSFKNQPYFVHWYLVPNSKAGLYRIGEPDNVETIESQTNISIYPNPTQTELTISAREMSSVNISNIAGIIIHKEDASSDSVVINTLNWAPGIYVATIRTVKGKTIHRKIIKE